MRDCNGCYYCCKVFDIDDTGYGEDGGRLQKPSGTLCPHFQDHKCDIHDKLGRTCANYGCLWYIEFLPAWMKPSEIGIVFDRFMNISDRTYIVGYPDGPMNAEAEKNCIYIAKMGIPIVIVDRSADYYKRIIFEPREAVWQNYKLYDQKTLAEVAKATNRITDFRGSFIEPPAQKSETASVVNTDAPVNTVPPEEKNPLD